MGMAAFGPSGPTTARAAGAEGWREQPSAGRRAVREERSKGQRGSGVSGLGRVWHHDLHPSTPNPRVEPTALSRWPAKVVEPAVGVFGSSLGPGPRGGSPAGRWAALRSYNSTLQE